jgi:hypothetical protein
MEESTLKKKIDIDLKVLAKIENEKNPGETFHYKVVKVDDSEESEKEEFKPEKVFGSLVQDQS